MKKYLIAVNVLLNLGNIITIVPLDFKEITINNLDNLKQQCLRSYEIAKLNPIDITILGWSEFGEN